MQAYRCPILFQHPESESPGFIYYDEEASLVRIVPDHQSNLAVSVILDGQDLVALIRLGLPILSPGEVDVLMEALTAAQKLFLPPDKA